MMEMEMERGIDPDAPLDYVELKIFPSQNRYEACVSSSNRTEKVAAGTLEQLLLHSSRVKDLSCTGSNTNFKVLPPDNADDAEWFTTATFTRFLYIVGSPEILSIGNEIAQLEETRKFQLSLSVKAEVDITSSIDSKNELLRAVELRLTALKDEIAAAFDQATGARCSTKDLSDLENFAHHFGAKKIRDSLQKFVETSHFPSVEYSRNGSSNKTEKSAPALRPSQLDPPIKYGVSPAKVAQVERQGSTDDENSSFSSENDQPSVERSRASTRSATPRRSASPMRRIQIGRSGSRRATALTIKSLNYFPAREKVVFQRDAVGNSSDEEDPEKPPKNNVLRMSVQDKISLFESKQRDQTVDVPKTKTLLNTTVGANKAVLRRWSSGMGEGATRVLPDANTKTSPISPENVAPEAESESCTVTSQVSAETAENITPHSPERGAPEPSSVKVETLEPEREEICEKHPASVVRSQQKEAEPNQLFMEMMDNKPVRQRNPTTDINKSKKSPKEQRGGFYDHYKQKRDEKLRGEVAGKRAEKEAQFKVMQRFLDERKAEMASTNVIDVNSRHTTANKPQKTQKNSTALTNSRKEATKPSVLKKATSKTSALPATRKSWSSTPSPRATGASPARTPTGPTSASTTPTSRKPQSASSAVRSSTKSEKSQPRATTPKATPPDANRSHKTVSEKEQPTVTKSTKTIKAEVRTTEVDNATAAKPSFYNKVTKKRSVVPLETKPFLRKGSGIGPGVGPVVIKTKFVAQPEETLGSSGILIQAEDNEVVMTTDINADPEECEAPEMSINLDSESQVLSPTKCEESVSSNQVNISGGDGFKRIEFPKVNSGTEEELIISPTAWVEVVQHHQEEIIPCKESPVQIVSPKVVAPARISSPRVRYSLSQMLLEENSEADIGEWGNAEHPPALVYQKDSPKGLKRLLKFARKAKADSHLTGWSSPSAFSEGDDDAEESKGQTNISRFTAQNVSSSVNTTKATRSFFSLSTFRGSKTNGSKVP
ncbi:histone H3.v1-like isoform X2 [Cynara cardunculus var. scolymus]|uniref:histone H3.v1-like isoform X2 n=1 Tax=Cynara cardunculus var. scolymus TaxID=59895 RepID=UPI000D629CBD|nr:histone H3.v1-like isoform X2 [Cynara cardunculus var. scolymus]XP_024989496.1 histone H3.v1-like isoform X2 [Cynara cardunculus var. scolymus]